MEWLRHGWGSGHVFADPLPPRDIGGKFQDTRYAGLVPTRTLIGGDYEEPYYTSASITTLRDKLLPSMRLAKELTRGRTKAWDPSAPNIRASVRHLLDVVGGVLHRGARTQRCRPDLADPDGPAGCRTLRGSEAFAKPLDAGDACMWVSKALVKAHACMNIPRAGGYLHVAIGARKGGKPPIYEYAHRIVAWAMLGPPLEALQAPVVMHTCADETCLNPRHLVWGESAENSTPRKSYLHAWEHLVAEGRPVPAKLERKLVRLGFH